MITNRKKIPYPKPHTLNPKHGFTLIEIIVAIGIFSIVMLIAVGALLSVIGANRNARATEAVVNNLNFALESMVREIRVGTSYHCGDSGNVSEPADCYYSNGGDNILIFEQSGGDPDDPADQTVVKLEGGRISRSDTGINGSFLPITSPSINVETLRFYVYGGDPLDEFQPRVLIVLKGEVLSALGESEKFNVQTSVTQRLLD